ncbi:MAG TPA: hypothetical protein VEP49_06875 [Acidimicrobiia bacterium]|nr:hypothetical protein [Acidimicrobiia bacterium]
MDSERVASGFDYCTAPPCVDACFEPVDVVALGVNKAADQYLLRRHLDLPATPARAASKDDDTLGGLDLGNGRERAEPRRRRRGAGERIAELEAALDTALAGETDPVRRRKLVDDHNAQLRRLNIRYRRAYQRRG